MSEYSDMNKVRDEPAEQAQEAMPRGPYHYAIRHELQARMAKLHMEIQLIQDTLKRLTPEVEDALIVAKNLHQLGMRTKF